MTGPFKMAINNNDLNSLCFSSTKATIVHCILELQLTVLFILIHLVFFGERVIIYVQVDYGNLVFFLCKFWKPLPPPPIIWCLFFSWALLFHIPQL